MSDIDLIRCGREDASLVGTWHWQVGLELDGEQVRAVHVNGGCICL